MVESQQVSQRQAVQLLESVSFRKASSCNMLKRLLVTYGRHDKPGLCFKAYILFPDLEISIIHYVLFNQEGYFVG